MNALRSVGSGRDRVFLSARQWNPGPIRGSPMTNSTFDRWLLGAAGFIALLVAAAALNFQNTRELNDVAGRVAQTHAVMDAIEEVHGSLRESQAVQRTFLIVGGDEVPAE